MSKNRMINTRLWSDPWVVESLNPLDRYLFLYLLTNDKTSVCGIYEIPLKTIANETGIDKEEIERMMSRLEPKVFYIENWIVLPNFVKHQAKNPSIEKGIETELALIPEHIKAKIDQALTGSDRLAQSPGNLKPKLKTKTKKEFKKDLTNVKSTAVAVSLTTSQLKNQNPEIAELISRFETEIGSLNRLPQQTFAAAEMLKLKGLQRTLNAISAAAACRGERFAPNIASLEDLRDKWVNLENFYARQRTKQPKGAKIR